MDSSSHFNGIRSRS